MIVSVIWLLLAAQLGRVDVPVDPKTQVVVLVNEAVPESVSIGEYYAARRGVPASHVLRVRASAEEIVTWPEFREQILGPFAEFVRARPEVIYAAVCYGVPVKTREEYPDNDAPGEDTVSKMVTNRDYGAIDRELELARIEHEIEGWIRSESYGRESPADGIVMVSRLDGPTPAAARALIDNALYGEAFGIEGRHHLDTRGLKSGGYQELDDAMRRIADVFAAVEMPLVHEDTDEVVDLSTMEDLAHYWGWYTGSIKAARPFTFRRGAVGAHLHSFSASSFRSETRTWTGPLVARGITGTCGTVYEPLGSGFPDGALFFERLLAGYPFAQAMTFANMFTSWQAIFVGDPLYAPYSKSACERQARNRATLEKARAELERMLDRGEDASAPEIEPLVWLLDPGDPGDPVRFLARERRARAASPETKIRGTVAALRAALAAGDVAGALRISPVNFEANLADGRIESLERARAVEPDSAEVQARLARAHLAARRFDEALAAIEIAIVQRPEHRLLGEILLAQKRYDDVVMRLRGAHEAAPSDSELGRVLAEAYLKTGAPAEALAVLEAGLADLPATPAQAERYEELLERLEKAAARDVAKRALYKEARKQWRLGRSAERDVRRVREAVDALAVGAAELAPLPDYPDPVAGISVLRVASRHVEPVEYYVDGPTARSASLRELRGSGDEPVEAWGVLPGVYRIAVVVGRGESRKVFVREQRIEFGRAYGLAIDESDRLYRPRP